MNALTSSEGRDPSLDHLLTAGTEFARVVAMLSESDWDRPTPCPRWDVRDLVAHTLSIAEALVRLAQDNDVPRQVRPDELHSARHTADRFTLAVERGWRAWGGLPLAQMRDFPWGCTPAHRLLDFSTVEFMAHGWDLATAIGVRISMPDDTVAAASVTVASGMLDVAPAGDFAAPVSIPPGASSLDRFVALLGRTPDVAILGAEQPAGQ